MEDVINQLDKLLKFFVESNSHHIMDSIIDGMNNDYSFPVHELRDKLVKDGYVLEKQKVVFKSPYSEYSLTIEGRIFYRNGGYGPYYKAEKSKNQNLRIRTFLLTYGTTLAGVYGLFEILKWIVVYYQTYICHCHFVLENMS